MNAPGFMLYVHSATVGFTSAVQLHQTEVRHSRVPPPLIQGASFGALLEWSRGRGAPEAWGICGRPGVGPPRRRSHGSSLRTQSRAGTRGRGRCLRPSVGELV